MNAGSQTILHAAPASQTTVAEEVVKRDQEVIKDYKEDIDTLLVFAGLFSAVMTAFLIESYKTLLPPDQRNPAVEFLRQISSHTRSYKITVDFHNATASEVSTSSTFEPPLSAIRVNVLWFASLIFSLASASFGMLVKQWLHEYLARAGTSSQARLRILQYRRIGLTRWQVLTIAGILPLMLHIALGLFFIGLCFFTASVHPSISRTATPLVAGWAFCFVFFTLAPMLSPRCPYKTPILKSTMQSTRRYFLPTLRALVRLPPLSLVATETMNPIRQFRRLSNVILYSHVMEQILGGLRRLAHEQDDREEDSIAKDEGNDLHNLINADSLVTDDNLLGSEMRNLINEAKAPPNEVLEFIKSILKHRGVDTGSLPSPLDLRPLTLQGRTAVLDIISDASKRPPSSSDPDWMCTAFLVFISPSNGHDIAPYIETIQSYIKDKSLELPDLKEVQWLDEKHFDDMMGNIGKALQGLGGKHTFRLLNSILSWRLKRQASDFKFADIAAIEWEEYTTSASLMKMVSMLLGALDREIDRIVRGQEFHWDKWTDNILKAIIGLVDALREDLHPDTIAEVNKMLLKMTSSPELWWRLIRSIAEYPRPMDPGIILPLHVIKENKSNCTELVLANFRDFVTARPDSGTTLMLWYMTAFMAYMRPESTVLATLSPILVLRLSRSGRTVTTDQEKMLAGECLQLIQSSDQNSGMTYEEWLRNFNVSQSTLSDEFIEALSRIARSGLQKTWRVQRLEHIRKQAEVPEAVVAQGPSILQQAKRKLTQLLNPTRNLGGPSAGEPRSLPAVTEEAAQAAGESQVKLIDRGGGDAAMPKGSGGNGGGSGRSSAAGRPSRQPTLDRAPSDRNRGREAVGNSHRQGGASQQLQTRRPTRQPRYPNIAKDDIARGVDRAGSTLRQASPKGTGDSHAGSHVWLRDADRMQESPEAYITGSGRSSTNGSLNTRTDPSRNTRQTSRDMELVSLRNTTHQRRQSSQDTIKAPDVSRTTPNANEDHNGGIGERASEDRVGRRYVEPPPRHRGGEDESNDRNAGNLTLQPDYPIVRRGTTRQPTRQLSTADTSKANEEHNGGIGERASEDRVGQRYVEPPPRHRGGEDESNDRNAGNLTLQPDYPAVRRGTIRQPTRQLSTADTPKANEEHDGGIVERASEDRMERNSVEPLSRQPGSEGESNDRNAGNLGHAVVRRGTTRQPTRQLSTAEVRITLTGPRGDDEHTIGPSSRASTVRRSESNSTRVRGISRDSRLPDDPTTADNTLDTHIDGKGHGGQ